LSQPDWFRDALESYQRVAIVGGPKTGKTTLAATVTDRTVLGTDELIGMDWSALSAEVVRRGIGLKRFVFEGVRVAHALRKGLVVDAVVWLGQPKGELTAGQVAMHKAVRTVLAEWRVTHRDVPVIDPAGST
jgi:hypothetical protein